MKRLILIVIIIFSIFFIYKNQIDPALFNQLKNEGLRIIDEEFLNPIEEMLGLSVPEEEEAAPALEKPELDEPVHHTFSIYGIEIGTPKEQVEAIAGKPQRTTLNEYGKYWHAYHKNYEHFLFVMYDENEKVVGLYTNQDLISSSVHIQLGTDKNTVESILGDPLTKILKGFVYYEIPADANYQVYLMDQSYITIFYDIHEGNIVTAMQIIHEEVENGKKDFYQQASNELREGFEYQMYDLVNAARRKHRLPVLSWDEHVRKTARDHSVDMAEQNYFSHTNLEGQSPFDRMAEDNLSFTYAGENLAYGQFSSIFAHEGLMNSKGHRDNILKREFKYLGVGVAFNERHEPFYTQNFYAK